MKFATWPITPAQVTIARDVGLVRQLNIGQANVPKFVRLTVKPVLAAGLEQVWK